MTDFTMPGDLLPHAPPFLFIDEVLACDDTSVRARRRFRPDEEFFRGHFPGRPIVPGVLLVEAMAQCFAYLALRRAPGALVYLTGVDRARFRKPVLPGQVVELTVQLTGSTLGLVNAKAEARVDGAKVADAHLIGRVTPREE